MKIWLHIVFVFIIRMIMMFVILYIPSAFLVGTCGVLSGYSRIFYILIILILLIGYPTWKALDVYDRYKKNQIM